MEYPRTPDILVFKGVALTLAQQRKIRSWRILPPEKPAPSVVFEVISDNSPARDLVDNPVDYAGTGIREYFCYDPRMIRKKGGDRLHGLHYSGSDAEAIEPDAKGRLWSQELESWLVPNGLMLRLTDAAGKPRLTKAEAEERQAAQARREAERERAEKQAAEERERVARAEAARAENEAAQARDEAAREREENERLRALLRSFGRDISNSVKDM